MIIGIDPGKAGGFSFNFLSGKILSYAMPDSMKEIAEDFEETVDTYCEKSEARFCYIEKVHTMPKQGIVSAGTFMKGYGGLLMLLTVHRIPFERVTPQAWQKALAIPKRNKLTESQSDFKKRLMRRAGELDPELYNGITTLKAKLSICDARLVLEHGMREKGVVSPF